MIPLGMTWLRTSNKYLENLYRISTSDYGTVTVHRNDRDKPFEKEFEYIFKNIGL